MPVRTGGYRKHRGAKSIDWIDVNSVSGDSVAPRLSRIDALERFHVMDKIGQFFLEELPSQSCGLR